MWCCIGIVEGYYPVINRGLLYGLCKWAVTFSFMDLVVKLRGSVRKMIIGDSLQEDGWAVSITITAKSYPKVR